MARPTTKDLLLEIANDNFDKLSALIQSINQDDQEKIFSFEDRDKNIRDVLIHLYEWHQLIINWINTNRSGMLTNFLPEAYNWKTYPEMNIGFWKKHQQTPLNTSKELLHSSHLQVMSLIESFTNDELFTKKHFSWTGTTSVGSYFVSSTSSHYDWAIKKIKKHKKDLIA